MADRTRSPTRRHERIETSNFLMIVLILLVVAVGGLVEIVPLFFQRSTTAAGGRAEALHRAAARRPRRLRARGLLQLPLADDPAVPRRDAALRPLLAWPASSSTTTRSSGAASAPAPTCTASAASYSDEWHRAAPDQPARPGARVEHAGLSVAGARPRSTPARCGAAHDGAARASACRTATTRSPARAEAVQGQDRARRAGRLPAGARHRGQVNEEHA